jgi:ABC-type Mn2+/Zn2+ transport system ATPase subunit
MSCLKLEGLSVGYDRPLLTIDSAAIDAGERVALTGDNGSGKSTLVKTLVGLLPSLAGRCIAPARHGLGYLPQQGSEDRQFPLSVYEWVLSGLTGHLGPFGAFRRPDHARVTDLLDRLGLLDRSKAPLQELSGGQWQRTRLARLLVQGSHCLMLDEPFNNIDELSQSLILAELQLAAQFGCPILCVLHDMALARRAFDTHWHLCDGHLHRADLRKPEALSGLQGTRI